MSYANILNDYAFKYVFGENDELTNEALKCLLSVFLSRKVKNRVVKNPEINKFNKKMNTKWI